MIFIEKLKLPNEKVNIKYTNMKKKIVILSFYLPGIYPQGDDSVVLNLLAPAYLKAALDSEKKLSRCSYYR